MSSFSHLPEHLSGSDGVSWLVECLLVGIEQVTSDSSAILRKEQGICVRAEQKGKRIERTER
jgi:hypothetical protein